MHFLTTVVRPLTWFHKAHSWSRQFEVLSETVEKLHLQEIFARTKKKSWRNLRK